MIRHWVTCGARALASTTWTAGMPNAAEQVHSLVLSREHSGDREDRHAGMFEEVAHESLKRQPTNTVTADRSRVTDAQRITMTLASVGDGGGSNNVPVTLEY